MSPSPIISSPTYVRRRPRWDFSITGMFYVCMMMFMAIAAMNTQANLLFGVFGLMLGVLLVSGIISRLVLSRLRLRRVLPDHAVACAPVAVGYELTNGKRWWPTLGITISELDAAHAFYDQPHGYLLHAAARQSATAPASVRPRRRGVIEFGGFQLSTSFPFGFIRRALTLRQRDSLLVYPPIGEVDRRLLRLLHSARGGAMDIRPRPGGQDEFYGVREYLPGDSPRHIYWRRSARTLAAGGNPVAKEMTHVSPPRVLVALDNYTGQGGEDPAHVERAIAVAASLITAADGAGLHTGLFAWGGDDWVVFPPNRGKRHRRDLLSALATLGPNTRQPPDLLRHQALAAKRPEVTAVFVTAGDPLTAPADDTRRGTITLNVHDARTKQYIRFTDAVEFGD